MASRNRIPSAIKNKGYHSDNAKMLDITLGAQQGFLPRIGRKAPKGATYHNWINNAAYVSRSLIPVVIDTPEFFDFFQDNSTVADMKKTYVELIEMHPETIDGLTATVTVETDEHRLGGGGEFQKETTNTVRARSAITFTWREKLGKPINRFLDVLVRYGDMDPDLKIPLITLVSAKDKIKTEKGIYTPEMKSGTVLFIEPDLAHINVVEAYMVTNFFPLTAGEITSKRDLSAAGEMKVYSVEFSSIVDSGVSTRAYAQEVLDGMMIPSPDETPVLGTGTRAPSINPINDATTGHDMGIATNPTEANSQTPDDVVGSIGNPVVK